MHAFTLASFRLGDRIKAGGVTGLPCSATLPERLWPTDGLFASSLVQSPDEPIKGNVEDFMNPWASVQ